MILQFSYDNDVEIDVPLPAAKQRNIYVLKVIGNTAMTKSKTAILWGQVDLLSQAMEIFLTSGEDWDVIRISSQEGVATLVAQVQRTKPDLVIFCQGKFDCASDPLMKMILDQPELRVLTDQPEARVIAISLENNQMQVYTKHSITVREVSDLLSIVEDRHFSDYPIEKEVHQAGKND